MTISDQLLARLTAAHSVVAFTGAGMSAESGVPTFRGNQGLWKKFKPEELANLDAFSKNPTLVWEWYSTRKRIISQVQPNPGHRALVDMEQLVPSLVVVTQNIDNLHRRAGSSTVFELHGNIERNYCLECGARFEDEEIEFRDGIPHCRECSGLVRPDVVWFGELLPMDQWEGAELAIRSADVVLTVGTSGVVYPAADLPMQGRRAGAYVAEINPEPTELTPWVDEAIRGSSGQVLPVIVEMLKQRRAAVQT